MTLPFDANIDVRLGKGRERRRYMIKTLGPSEWQLVTEDQADTRRETVTDPAIILAHHQAITRVVDLLVGEGWTSMSADNGIRIQFGFQRRQ